MLILKIFAFFLILNHQQVIAQYGNELNLILTTNEITSFEIKRILGFESTTCNMISGNRSLLNINKVLNLISGWIPQIIENKAISTTIGLDFFGNTLNSTNFAIIDSKNIIYWTSLKIDINNFKVDFQIFDKIGTLYTCFDIQIFENLIFIDCNMENMDYIITFDTKEIQMISIQNQTEIYLKGQIRDYIRKIKILFSLDNSISLIRYYSANSSMITEDSVIQIFNFDNSTMSFVYNFELNATSLSRGNFFLAGLDTYLDHMYFIFCDGTIYDLKYSNTSEIISIQSFPLYFATSVTNFRIFSNYNKGSNEIIGIIIVSNEIYLYSWKKVFQPILSTKFEFNLGSQIYQTEFSSNYIIFNTIEGDSYALRISKEKFSNKAYVKVSNYYQSRYFMRFNESAFISLGFLPPISIQAIIIQNPIIKFNFSKVNYELNDSWGLICSNQFITINYSTINKNNSDVFLINNSIKSTYFENSQENRIDVANYFLGPNLSYSARINQTFWKTNPQKKLICSSSFEEMILFIYTISDLPNYYFIQIENYTIFLFSSFNDCQSSFQLNLSSKIQAFSAAYHNNNLYFSVIFEGNINEVQVFSFKNTFNLIKVLPVENSCNQIELFESSNQNLILLCSFCQDISYWIIEQNQFSQESSFKSSIANLNNEISFCFFTKAYEQDYLYINQEDSIIGINMVYLYPYSYSIIFQNISIGYNISELQNSIFIDHDTMVIYSNSNNFIQEYDIESSSSNYLKKNYSMWDYKSVSNGSYNPKSKTLSFLATINSTLFILLYETNQLANSNLKSIIACSFSTMNPLFLSYFSFEDNEYLMIAYGDTFEIIQIFSNNHIHFYPSYTTNSYFVQSSLDIIAENDFQNIISNANFSLQVSIWNPILTIGIKESPSNETLNFPVNYNNEVETVSYQFNYDKYFNGTVTDFNLLMEYSCDLQYSEIEPFIFQIKQEAIHISASVLDFLYIDEYYFLLEPDLISKQINGIAINETHINATCTNINSDSIQRNLFLFCQNQIDSLLYILNLDLNITMIHNLGSKFDSRKMIIKDTYLFVLVPHLKIRIFYLNYLGLMIKEVIEIFAIDDSLMNENMLFTDFDVGVIHRGYRFFISDMNYGLRTAEVELDELYYRVYYPPGIVLVEDIDFLLNGLSKSDIFTSLVLIENDLLSATLIISTSLNTFKLHWEMDEQAEHSSVRYIKTFVGRSSNSINLYYLKNFLIVSNKYSEDNNEIIIYDDMKQLSGLNTAIGFLNTSYPGKILTRISDFSTIIFFPNQSKIEYYNITNYPMISFLSGEISSSYLYIEASNKLSSQVLQFYLDNKNPALTTKQKIIRVIIFTVVGLIVIALLLKWAYSKFKKGKFDDINNSNSKEILMNTNDNIIIDNDYRNKTFEY